MSLIVQKFGGTSLANPQCIENVAEKVMKTKQQGHDIVVVVSAMSGETDRLLGLAKRLQPTPNPREYSALLATGEQASMALLTMALLNRDCPAKSFSGAQVKVRTEGFNHQARIKHVDTDKILKELNEGCVVVLAGFQGINAAGEMTTIGRGGSDTTAVAVAAALNASECQIFTDVEGVFTADPRIVSDAKPIEKVSFDEMIELASLGAKVLQHRAVEFAGKYNVPLRVLSTFEEGAGTLITLSDKCMEDAIISGITYSKSEAKVTLTGLPALTDVSYKILEPIGSADIGVDMIMHNAAQTQYRDFSFTINREHSQQTQAILHGLNKQLGAQHIDINEKIGKLSIVGLGLKSNSGIASKVLQTLVEEGITIYNIVTSEIKISVLIDEKYIELGVRVLHEAFGLEKL